MARISAEQQHPAGLSSRQRCPVQAPVCSLINPRLVAPLLTAATIVASLTFLQKQMIVSLISFWSAGLNKIFVRVSEHVGAAVQLPLKVVIGERINKIGVEADHSGHS